MFWKPLTLLAAIAVWIGLLWLVLPFDFMQLSLIAITALHLLPPFGLWLSCLLGVRWFKRRHQVRAQVAELALLTDREKRKAEHKTQFDHTLSQRRAAIQCRWGRAADVICRDQLAQLPDRIGATTADQVDGDPSWPASTLAAVLDQLFSDIPIAAGFPISVIAPRNLYNVQIARQIKQARLHSMAHHKLKTPHGAESTTNLESLPDANLHAYVSDQFAAHPDWPGLVIIAFDSPWQPALESEFWQTHEAVDVITTEKWLGKPSRALTCMLFTPAHIDMVLAKISTLTDATDFDEMAPHWDKQKIPAGMANYLCRFPRVLRESLFATPILALWHRPEDSVFSTKEPASTRIAKIAAAIKSAAENACLIEPICEFEGEIISEAKQPAFNPQDCGHLIHNAGTLEVYGERFASLASAMMQTGIELDPIYQAINTTIAMGDCGVASPGLQLVLAISRIGDNGLPTLIAQFDSGGMRVSLLSPAKNA